MDGTPASRSRTKLRPNEDISEQMTQARNAARRSPRAFVAGGALQARLVEHGDGQCFGQSQQALAQHLRGVNFE